MGRTISGTVALAALAAVLIAGHGQATAAPSAPKPLAHCNWGDFGCTNPPPKAAAPAKAGTRSAPKPVPVGPQQKLLTGAPGRAKSACDPDLSSGGECWTNCKTEEDITICDIISLDTFWPEAPVGPAKVAAFTGRTVQKTAPSGRKAIGRVMR